MSPDKIKEIAGIVTDGSDSGIPVDYPGMVA